MAKVLVIDDSPLIFKMIKKALEPKGFEMVGSAENGKIGLEKYKELQPDIITLDVTMPVMDGLETAKNLFQINPEVKIVMLSAMGDDDLLDTARKIGIKNFHQKPINGDELADLINSMLD